MNDVRKKWIVGLLGLAAIIGNIFLFGNGYDPNNSIIIIFIIIGVIGDIAFIGGLIYIVVRYIKSRKK